MITNLRKMKIYNPNLILSMLMCIQNLVKFAPFILNTLSGNEKLTELRIHGIRKGRVNTV